MKDQRAETPEKITGIGATKRFLVANYGDLEYEMLLVAHLGSSEQCLRVSSHHGTRDFVEFPFREILRDVIRFDSKALIISHNHLSDDPNPSANDIKATRSLVELLKPIDVDLLDHIIVTPNSVKSFHDVGLL